MDNNRLKWLWRAALIALLLALIVPTIPAHAETAAQTGVTATPTVYLRLRSGPGTNNPQIGLVPPGTRLAVLGRNSAASWVQVNFNGTQGWMAAWYCTITGDLISVPVTDSGASGSELTATTTVNLRVRSGPGITFTQLTYAPTGTTVLVTGRNAAGDWLNVIYGDTRGWMAAWYTIINGDLNSVPVTDGTAGGGTTVTPPPPPPAATSGFELGGQTHTLAHPDLMRSAGMTWVKFQQKWTPGMDPGVVAGLITAAHNNGFRVLISAPGPAYPSSIDYGSYVQFLRGVALLGADAIEVWNEMNLNREWPSGQVDPAAYVNNMLAPAYREIKAANPNTIVIAGALAPTGVNIGNDIWSDDRYLAGMAAAGAASYMDCLGVHHNAGATSPDATSGHPADGGGGHYSWYFGPTLNLYAANFPTRPLCYTEIGYLSPDGYGTLPGNFSWGGGTSVSEHAQWLGRAIQLLRASGRVRLAIVYNVDFTVWQSDDPQAGYAILRPDGSCPACSSLAAAMQ
jgi:uncharacterized protein YraI